MTTFVKLTNAHSQQFALVNLDLVKTMTRHTAACQSDGICSVCAIHEQRTRA